MFTHGELSQRRGHADGRQEDVGGGFAGRQSAEQVVSEVRGGGAHLSGRRGEELHMFLLCLPLLTSRDRLKHNDKAIRFESVILVGDKKKYI